MCKESLGISDETYIPFARFTVGIGLPREIFYYFTRVVSCHFKNKPDNNTGGNIRSKRRDAIYRVSQSAVTVSVSLVRMCNSTPSGLDVHSSFHSINM